MLLHASWEDVVFLHFIVAPQLLRRRLPDSLRLDRPLGEAWITLTAMRSRGPAPLPPRLLRGVPSFAQVNLRTYVVGEDGEPGLFFLDQAVSSGTMAAASRLFGLHQHGADVSVKRDGDAISVSLEQDCEGDEHEPAPFGEHAHLSLRVRVAGPTLRATHDPIGRALLERYVGYDGLPPRKTRVEHAPWVVQSLDIEEFESSGLLPEGARLAAAQYGTPRVVAVGIPHGLAIETAMPIAEPA